MSGFFAVRGHFHDRQADDCFHVPVGAIVVTSTVQPASCSARVPPAACTDTTRAAAVAQRSATAQLDNKDAAEKREPVIHASVVCSAVLINFDRSFSPVPIIQLPACEALAPGQR